jgi:hypothetical protein
MIFSKKYTEKMMILNTPIVKKRKMKEFCLSLS